MSVYGLYLGTGILRAYSIISGKEVKDLHGWETSSEGADTYEKKQE